MPKCIRGNDCPHPAKCRHLPRCPLAPSERATPDPAGPAKVVAAVAAGSDFPIWAIAAAREMWHPAGSDYAIRETAEIITRHYLRYGRKQEIKTLEIHERAQNLTAHQAARLAELRNPNIRSQTHPTERDKSL